MGNAFTSPKRFAKGFNQDAWHTAARASSARRYAQQAKDCELLDHATEIRKRAEIRAGELLAEMAERGQREAKGGDRKSKSQPETLIPKLSDLGVSKSQSSRWQQMAALPKNQQEALIEQAKKTAVAAVDRRRAARGRSRKASVAPPNQAPSIAPPEPDIVALAISVRRRTRDPEIISLCDWILANKPVRTAA